MPDHVRYRYHYTNTRYVYATRSHYPALALHCLSTSRHSRHCPGSPRNRPRPVLPRDGYLLRRPSVLSGLCGHDNKHRGQPLSRTASQDQHHLLRVFYLLSRRSAGVGRRDKQGDGERRVDCRPDLPVRYRRYRCAAGDRDQQTVHQHDICQRAVSGHHLRIPDDRVRLRRLHAPSGGGVGNRILCGRVARPDCPGHLPERSAAVPRDSERSPGRDCADCRLRRYGGNHCPHCRPCRLR